MRISLSGAAALLLALTAVAASGQTALQAPAPAVPDASPVAPTTVAPVTVIGRRPLPPGPPRLELYEGRDFAGNGVFLVEPSPNLMARGFSDRARSARVFGTAWQVCNGPDFAPPCVTLEADSPFLGEFQLSERVSSARPLASAAPAR